MLKEVEVNKMNTKDVIVSRPVRWWLLVGVVMVFFQVFIGGVTRLTDSGLSITEWAVIQGTLPPMNQADWDLAFDKYKVAAKKQYESLHGDMTLSEFKVIFFWEYFHRLWARMMGFVFLFPFLFFLFKGMLPSWMVKRLGVVILLAMLAATFGWIMVASGLNDDTRTWVSAYKLMTHLAIATVLFAYLYWTWLRAQQPFTKDEGFYSLKRFAWIVTGVLFVQILLGGLMAGMRAGLVHPYFPFFVEGDRLLEALTNNSDLSSKSLVNYESAAAIKAWVQIVHRGFAYILSFLILGLFFKARKLKISKNLNKGLVLLVSLLVIQFILGILTVINSIGRIPIFYGVFHQAVALLLLISLLTVNYQFSKTRIN